MASLLDLSDELLLTILSHLDASEIIDVQR